MYLVHLQEGPRGAGFWQGHPSVFVSVSHRKDLADEAGEVSLLSELGLKESSSESKEVVSGFSPPQNEVPVIYLEVTEEHLSELLHRRASGGLIEHRGFSAWLWLLAQLVVHDLPQLTADDPVVVSPASGVHLANPTTKQLLDDVNACEWSLHIF